ncbi:MAG: FKBP-type peptidyl-prolyl cis-trans isomerase [Treponema sp.]|nr:FKBP-type peptidyl-prolyl cis-trans isomerase [Treponema sp.]MCL2243574.1 FKBP-type peptidyl-prolyl cis-trans isomerase [Treponema sp.]
MKKLIALICLIVPVLSLHARAIQEDFRKAEEKARVSYAAGMLMGKNLQPSGLDLDYDAFAEGFKAGFGDFESQFSEMEAVDIVETALQAAADKIAAQNRQVEEEFLAMNGARPGIYTTSSGLQYDIIVETDGEKPGPDSIVFVMYEGAFLNGTVFDSSYEDGGAYIPLDRVIPGWAEALQLMGVGSTYIFYIPSYLAYGEAGIQQVIPPYATLVFRVGLLNIVTEDDLYGEF